MPKLKSPSFSLNSRSAKAMLAVPLAIMLSAGSAYADPDQPSTDSSGGTETGSTEQPAAGGKPSAGAVCTRHADAIKSTEGSLTALQGIGTSILSHQDAIGAQLQTADASDPADLARLQAEMASMRSKTQEMMQDLAEAQKAVAQAAGQS